MAPGENEFDTRDVEGTSSKGKETRTQINDLDQKEEINIQPE